MTFTWILNAVSLFAMTAGSLLFFLGLWESPRSTDDILTAEEQLANRKHRRLLAVGGGALSLWFSMQYLALILL